MNAAYFRQFSQYSAWANERLYAACAELSDEDRKRRRPSFFGSIHRTLNHILVGNRIWRSRLDGKPHGVTSLDEELYADFAALQAAARAEDQRLIDIIAAYTDADVAKPLFYRPISASMQSETRNIPMAQALGHIFNHQTHHRGQVHGLLSDTVMPPPPLDLVYYHWDEVG